MTDPVKDFISDELDHPVIPAADAVTSHLCQTYGSAVDAVVFYGSCLRAESDDGLLMDFYVLVRSYRETHDGLAMPVLNALLPPNVYYVEIPFEDRTARAKVAVMETRQFERAASKGFTSSIWARFSQPVRLTYARDDTTKPRLAKALSGAVRKMLTEAAPVAPNTKSETLWVTALKRTYGAELRPEGAGRAREIYDKDKARYDTLAQMVGPLRTRGGLAWDLRWALRSLCGKALNILRLMKAAFTFQGGLDYAVWKMERHSGVTIELTDAERARPLLTGLKLFWKARRLGAVR